MGNEVALFEQEFAHSVGAKYAVMVNSGSSANLIAIAALVLDPKQKLCAGDEVIVPALSWATTYFPLHQYGLKLTFVDIDRHTLNYDLTVLESAISKKTRAVVAVNILGNPNFLTEIKALCEERDLILFEDNCESLGAKYDERHAGTFGKIGTFSTFFSHHISTMEGGLAVTNSESLYEHMFSLRSHGWLRGLGTNNHVHEKTGDAFTDSFTFALPGYNLRPGEIAGAIGQEQIRKLPSIISGRRSNGKAFQERMADLKGFQIQSEIGESSWFGFSMTLTGELRGQRTALVEHLADLGVESRPVIAGNFLRNPAIRFLDYTVHGDLPNVEEIHHHGLFIGNRHEESAQTIMEIGSHLEKFVYK